MLKRNRSLRESRTRCTKSLARDIAYNYAIKGVIAEGGSVLILEVLEKWKYTDPGVQSRVFKAAVD